MPAPWCGSRSGRCSIRRPTRWWMHSVKGRSSYMDNRMIVVEVVYALADKQKLLRLSLPYGTTMRQAVEQSGMQVHFPGLDLFEQGAWRWLLFGLRLHSGWRRRHAGAILAKDRLIAADAWHEVAPQASQLIIAIEDHADAFLQAFTTTWLNAVQVVPAVGMEGVGQQRVAHDKPHLAAGHSGA